MTEIQVSPVAWSIFDKQYFKDESTTQYEYAQYKERNVNVINLTEYNMINQDLDIPLLVCDSFLQVKCRILNSATNTGYVNAGNIAFNNNGYNIFQRAQYYMNDQLVEDLDEVGVSTLVKGLIEYSKSYSESGCNELWELDNGLAGTNSGNFSDFSSFYAIGDNGCVYDILTVGAGGVILLTRRVFDGNAIHVDNQAVRLYVDGYEVRVTKYRGGNNQFIFNLTLQVNNALALVIIGSQQYDIYKLVRFDGAEVFIFTYLPPAVPQLTYLSAPGVGNQAILTRTLEVAANNVTPAAVAQNDLITVRVISSTNKFGFNEGYEKRRIRTLDNITSTIPNKYLNLFLPIRKMFKLFEYNQHVFRGIKHTIRLYKNLNNKTIFTRGLDTVNGTLEISDISWWVPTLRPSIEYGLKLDKELNSGMITKLQWNQLRCYASPEFPTATGVDAESYWRITSAGNKPIKVYVVFRISNQYANGADQNTANAMLFKHMNITNINLRINSMQFPKEEFTSDFVTNDDWIRLYLQYLQLSGKTFDTEGGGFSLCYNEFANLYPIFCFDLSKQDPQIWANVTQAELELRYRRAAQYTAPDNVNFRIYAIIEFEKSIQINGADNRMRVIM